MRINNNIMAMFAHRNYNTALNRMAQSMRRLSSGLRINSAADDPAGLAISEKMRAQIRGLNMASRNCQDAVSLIQTAEGAMGTTHDILRRMKELAVQAASDTNEGLDRKALDYEYQELLAEINDTAGKANFNNISLLDGSRSEESGKGLIIQTGPNSGDEMEIHIAGVNTTLLGLDGTNLLTRESASNAISSIDDAISQVSMERAKLGAKQNRLGFKIYNLENTAENLTAAESRIRDVDIAKEMMEYASASILMQASMSMMAQANSNAQLVLKLLDFR